MPGGRMEKTPTTTTTTTTTIINNNNDDHDDDDEDEEEYEEDVPDYMRNVRLMMKLFGPKKPRKEAVVKRAPCTRVNMFMHHIWARVFILLPLGVRLRYAYVCRRVFDNAVRRVYFANIQNGHRVANTLDRDPKLNPAVSRLSRVNLRNCCFFIANMYFEVSFEKSYLLKQFYLITLNARPCLRVIGLNIRGSATPEIYFRALTCVAAAGAGAGAGGGACSATVGEQRSSPIVHARSSLLLIVVVCKEEDDLEIEFTENDFVRRFPHGIASVRRLLILHDHHSQLWCQVALSKQFPNLEALTLREVDTRLVKLCPALTTLQEVEISLCESLELSFLRDLQACAHASLRQLTFSNDNGHRFSSRREIMYNLRYLINVEGYRNLKSLSLNAVTLEALPTLLSFLSDFHELDCLFLRVCPLAKDRDLSQVLARPKMRVFLYDPFYNPPLTFRDMFDERRSVKKERMIDYEMEDYDRMTRRNLESNFNLVI